MADSIVTFASIGQATSSFSFSFDYLEATDIDAFVEGVSVFANNTSTGTAVGGNTYTVAFSSAGSKTLTFSPAVPQGSTVRIERNTDLTSKAVDFSDGAVLTEVALDSAVDQLFFAVQESNDKTAEGIAVQPDGKFDALSKVIKNVANPTNAQDAATKAYVDAGDAAVVSNAVSQATAAANTAVNTATGNLIPDATKLAIHPVNSQYTLSDGSTTDYSAKHYQSVASAAAVAAASSETDAQASEDEAEAWAQKINGEAVTGEGYSAKAWATGGTGVTDTAGSGSAKEWATDTTNTADGTEYSAKEYAIGAQRRGQANGGSAKDWATYTGGTVDNASYSAKYWAQAAAASVATFDNKYFGSLSSDPTQDPDGSALESGDIYYSSSSGNMRVYNGSTWNDVATSTTGFASAGFAIAMSIALQE